MVVAKKAFNYAIKFFQSNTLNHVRRFAVSTLCNENATIKKRKFIESENHFAHNVLANLPQYKNSLLITTSKDLHEADINSGDPSSCNWEKLTITELCNKFGEVSLEARKNSSTIDKECYTDMCNVIAKRSPEIPDENLVTMLSDLSIWPLAPSAKEKNFATLWKALDNACLSRWKEWNCEKILFFTDLWYNLLLARQSDFVYRSITKLAMNPSRLSSNQLVQLLFYLNVLRTLNKNISMYDIEYKLEQNVHNLSIEEVGVAVMGFFKTQHIIHSEKLLNTLIDRVIEEKNTIPEISLTCILKILRGSLTIPIWERIPELMDAVETQLDRLSLQSSVHASLLAAKGLTLHEGTLTKISQNLCNHMQEARVKDMEKVIYPLVLTNFNPETSSCVFEGVVEQLNNPNRISEFNQYPRSLIALVYYLTLKDIYVENIVKKLLDIDFIRQTYGKTNYMIGREILGIDTYVELMQPSYQGPRLPVDVRNYLSRRYSTFLPDPKYKLSIHAKFTLDVFNTAQNLLGEKNVMFKYIIPHSSRADLVMHLSSDGRLLRIPDDYRNIPDFTGPVRPSQDGKWYSLVIASRNMYLHNKNVCTGDTTSKLKLLEALGYQPIVINYWDWPSGNQQTKVEYLKKLINI